VSLRMVLVVGHCGRAPSRSSDWTRAHACLN